MRLRSAEQHRPSAKGYASDSSDLKIHVYYMEIFVNTSTPQKINKNPRILPHGWISQLGRGLYGHHNHAFSYSTTVVE